MIASKIVFKFQTVEKTNEDKQTSASTSNNGKMVYTNRSLKRIEKNVVLNIKKRKDLLMEMCQQFEENQLTEIVSKNKKQIIMRVVPLNKRPVDILKKLCDAFES
jgi:hypothetical protein